MGIVGVGQGDIDAPITVLVEVSERPPVRDTIQTTDPRDVIEAIAAPIVEHTVCLLSAEGVAPEHPLPLNLGAGIQNTRHASVAACIDSFARKAFLQIVVRAHDRAPEVTSQVDLRGCARRGSVKTVGDIEIEKAIVVDVAELSTP